MRYLALTILLYSTGLWRYIPHKDWNSHQVCSKVAKYQKFYSLDLVEPNPKLKQKKQLKRRHRVSRTLLTQKCLKREKQKGNTARERADGFVLTREKRLGTFFNRI